jgi:hypothetical protein
MPNAVRHEIALCKTNAILTNFNVGAIHRGGHDRSANSERREGAHPPEKLPKNRHVFQEIPLTSKTGRSHNLWHQA